MGRLTVTRASGCGAKQEALNSRRHVYAVLNTGGGTRCEFSALKSWGLRRNASFYHWHSLPPSSWRATEASPSVSVRLPSSSFTLSLLDAPSLAGRKRAPAKEEDRALPGAGSPSANGFLGDPNHPIHPPLHPLPRARPLSDSCLGAGAGRWANRTDSASASSS
jgi:hypothetical protein